MSATRSQNRKKHYLEIEFDNKQKRDEKKNLQRIERFKGSVIGSFA